MTAPSDLTLHLDAAEVEWLANVLEHAAEGSCDHPCPIQGGCVIHRARHLQDVLNSAAQRAQQDMKG